MSVDFAKTTDIKFTLFPLFNDGGGNLTRFSVVENKRKISFHVYIFFLRIITFYKQPMINKVIDVTVLYYQHVLNLIINWTGPPHQSLDISSQNKQENYNCFHQISICM